MTSLGLGQLLDEYRAGLDAEMTLLQQLGRLPASTVDVEHPDGIARLTALTDERDRILAAVVELEAQLRPLRERLAASRDELRTLPSFETIARRHREAGDLVAQLLASDSDSLAALRHAEQARRFAAHTVERGENTLAAYRRVVAPRQDGARIVIRRG
jgi:hypothetical protein